MAGTRAWMKEYDDADDISIMQRIITDSTTTTIANHSLVVNRRYGQYNDCVFIGQFYDSLLCYMAICKALLTEGYSEALSTSQACANKSLQTMERHR